MLQKIICPISSERIDSNTSRLTVLINTILMVVFLLTLQPVYLYIVTIDYTIRALGSNRFSPICIIASLAIKAIGTKPKMIDKAPKVFASRLGLICAILGMVFFQLEMNLSSQIVIGFFTVLTFLDSVVDICVGCIIYQYIVFPFLGDKTT
jgi:hypothetical protein